MKTKIEKPFEDIIDFEADDVEFHKEAIQEDVDEFCRLNGLDVDNVKWSYKIMLKLEIEH